MEFARGAGETNLDNVGVLWYGIDRLAGRTANYKFKAVLNNGRG